jgi:hypothetical protein
VTSPPSETPEPRPEEVSAEIETLAKLTASPQFLSLIEEIQYASEPERLVAARRLATVDELHRRGVPIPEGTRFTTRYFENRPDGTRGIEQLIDTTEAAADEIGTWTLCASVGYIVCVTVGHNFVTVPEEMLPPETLPPS